MRRMLWAILLLAITATVVNTAEAYGPYGRGWYGPRPYYRAPVVRYYGPPPVAYGVYPPPMVVPAPAVIPGPAFVPGPVYPYRGGMMYANPRFSVGVGF